MLEFQNIGRKRQEKLLIVTKILMIVNIRKIYYSGKLFELGKY